jgi:hypothetical protein
MNLLIGSRALNHWVPEFKVKDETDWDIISDKPIPGAEWHDPNLVLNRELEQFASTDVINFQGHQVHVVNMAGLKIVKRSHLWRDLGWDKHIAHYHHHLAAVELSEAEQSYLGRRIEATKKAFPQRTPSLMQTKENFFDDAVRKVYDHDWLHSVVAYHEKPLYTRLLRQEGLVWCEKDKWDTFTALEKAQCVSEETMVIAVERFLLHSNWRMPKMAYYKALRKVCTTLCSGWFRDYAIDHFPEVLRMCDENRMKLVQKEIDNGNFVYVSD